MPITLMTGANGHGKGQLSIKEILYLQDENDKREKEGKPRRQIYANIHGINEPGNTPLPDVKPIPSDKIFFGKQDNPDYPPPEDYFIPPIGSIFFFDECQRLDWVKQQSGALSKDIRVISLEEHRHAGLDIYFITQSPNYIHSHIFGLVSPHYHCERALGLPMTNVFKFNLGQKNPNSPAVHKKADDHFTIKLGKHYGQYYKSSAEHNIKAKIPLKLKLAVGFLVIILSLLFYKYTQTKYYKSSEKEEALQTQLEDTQAQEDALILESQQFDEVITLLEKMNQRVDDMEAKLYESRLDPIYQVEARNPELRVSGVMSMGDKCIAINAYGDELTMQQDECNYYLTDSKVLKNRQIQQAYSDNDVSSSDLNSNMSSFNHGSQSIKFP